MKPYNPGGHSAYQDRVLAQLRKYYPDAVSSLPASTWAVMEKFWNLDLSGMDSLMADRYSDFGPAPRLPSDMLRSILLSVEFKVTSYTRWAADLKENHLHAILSGFPVGDTPGVGTFYDFLSRLWLSDKNNLSDPVHPPKEKPKKPEKKGEKAPPVEKVTVKDLLEQFELHPPKDMAPCKRLYEIFKVLFLNQSVNNGLIDLLNLSLAGFCPHRNVKNVPAAAGKAASATADATEPAASLTVISDGIPTGSVIISVMTCICSPPPIRKKTSLFSLSPVPLPGMIPSVSFITGSP